MITILILFWSENRHKNEFVFIMRVLQSRQMLMFPLLCSWTNQSFLFDCVYIILKMHILFIQIISLHRLTIDKYCVHLVSLYSININTGVSIHKDCQSGKIVRINQTRQTWLHNIFDYSSPLHVVWDVYCVYFEDRWFCYKGTALH